MDKKSEPRTTTKNTKRAIFDEATADADIDSVKRGLAKKLQALANRACMQMMKQNSGLPSLGDFGTEAANVAFRELIIEPHVLNHFVSFLTHKRNKAAAQANKPPWIIFASPLLEKDITITTKQMRKHLDDAGIKYPAPNSFRASFSRLKGRIRKTY